MEREVKVCAQCKGNRFFILITPDDWCDDGCDCYWPGELIAECVNCGYEMELS